MRLKDVRLKATPHLSGSVYINEKNSGALIGEFWSTPGLNERQMRLLTEKMCNALNAEQTYGELEGKR